MLSGKQVAALIKTKTIYLNILDNFMQKEKLYPKIPEANTFLNTFHEAFIILNFLKQKKENFSKAKQKKLASFAQCHPD
jgi:hypothetical protein